MTDSVTQLCTMRMQMLLGWRKRYVNGVYPSKVVRNVFYDLYALDAFWENGNIHNQIKQETVLFKNFQEAYQNVIENYGQIQTQLTNPRLQQLLNDSPMIHGLDWHKLSPIVNKAEKSDNDAVEEIEYVYIFYGTAVSIIQAWTGWYLTGAKKKSRIRNAYGVGNRRRYRQWKFRVGCLRAYRRLCFIHIHP